MASVRDVIAALRECYPTDFGYKFERLMRQFLQLDPEMSAQYDQVFLWSDWPFNQNSHDTGIDLVARRREDGLWAAIQCKCYAENASIQKGNLDSFFEASGRTFTTDRGKESYAERLIIATTDRWSRNAEDMLANQTIPTHRIGLDDLSESTINWELAFPNGQATVNLSSGQKFNPKSHQEEAIDSSISGFKSHDRGKLIMACGTGKTFTSLRFAERLADQQAHRGDSGVTVLFLVPSISLLSQTLREWVSQTRLAPLRPIAVCSDTRVSKAAEDIASYDLQIPVTTDGVTLANQLKRHNNEGGWTVVFSTYQSLQATHEAQKLGAPPFDLIICDEAHRTTGITLDGDDPSSFTRVHDNDYIRARKRLYMTATPRLFDDAVKGKAQDHSAEIASMDDEAIYGPEFYRLGFGEAVEKGLLTDYKVLVTTVDEQAAADAKRKLTGDAGGINLDQASAIIGAWNALSKRSGHDTKTGFARTDSEMRRAVGFTRSIADSKQITTSLKPLIHNYVNGLRKSNGDPVAMHHLDFVVDSEHVDGTMNALERNKHLAWLKAEPEPHHARMLTNARCLSEGVDVPSLDAVVFFSPRNSMVDVVQSIGRVMRLSAGKEYGYIVLPVAIPEGVSPSEALNDNRRFKLVWQILNALRAHDDRFNAVVNSVNMNEGSLKDLSIEVDHIQGSASPDSPFTDEEERDRTTQQVLFNLDQWQEALYTKIVDKVGTRDYWENWADDIARIAQTQTTLIRNYLDTASPRVRKEFDIFLTGLKANLNSTISADDGISMLSQHLITAPVFDALFEGSDFAAQNPVSRVMNRMLNELEDAGLENETKQLDRFYESVRVRASEVNSPSGKQTVMKDLYERFFRTAFPKQSEALGIVYTPNEVIDFILRGVNEAGQIHLGKQLTDTGVHVHDPFTGTGSFLAQLINSDLIEPTDLTRKYLAELHATEIMLLAYYVAAVNIENTYNTLEVDRTIGAPDVIGDAGIPATTGDGENTQPPYRQFPGIVFGDTFQMSETADILDEQVFTDNNDRAQAQLNAPIHVIIGNPPYSAGQTNANDLNANNTYPHLDQRIKDTYANRSTASNKNGLYDSYLRAIRWATDRIGDIGVVGFVSNGGWIDGNSTDGVRLSLQSEYQHVYVYNLRGNALGAGESRRKEKDNVFGQGTRTTVAIIIAVKDPHVSGCTIQYRDIGDYLTRDDKLSQLKTASLTDEQWQEITPNQHGDWINQRSDDFATWPILGDNRGKTDLPCYFSTYSNGLKTSRDAWVYNYSLPALKHNIREILKQYEMIQARFETWCVEEGINNPKEGSNGGDVTDFLKANPDLTASGMIPWTRDLRYQLAKNTVITEDADSYRVGLYRPFVRTNAHFNINLNEMRYRLPSMFPTQHHKNMGIMIPGLGVTFPFIPLATRLLPDLNIFTAGQFFPRWTYVKHETTEGQLDLLSNAGNVDEWGYQKVDNITDEIYELYQSRLGSDIAKDDIFYFVYGALHVPAYRENYGNDLKKMMPHIPLPDTRGRFNDLVKAGKELMDLHTNYESAPAYPIEIILKPGVDPEDPATWRVKKMRWKKLTDSGKGGNPSGGHPSTLLYNNYVTLDGIPVEAHEYILGSHSTINWIITRYQVTTDKKSGIVNDPNTWGAECGNPRYIVNLIEKVCHIAVETQRIISTL